jgi:hypothetical protein
MDIKKIILQCVEWMNLNQDKGKRRAFVNVVMNKMWGNFLSRWELLDSQEGLCTMELLIVSWL